MNIVQVQIVEEAYFFISDEVQAFYLLPTRYQQPQRRKGPKVMISAKTLKISIF